MTARLAAYDWEAVSAALDAEGHAVLPGLLSAEACTALAGLYAEPARFRSRVVMARHNFGRGEYQYFAHPLPAVVAALRESGYARLREVANRWAGAETYPAAHADYVARCAAAGQTRPTPLLLRYGAGDFNCLHQDLYGAEVFPLQLAVLLSSGFVGGELVLTEQRPRRQSRAMVVPWSRGDGVVFAVNRRPVAGVRGTYQAVLRHGVSTVRAGERFTLGVIFHDAA